MKKSLRFLTSILMIIISLGVLCSVSASAAEVLLVPSVDRYQIPALMTIDDLSYRVGDVNGDGLISIKDATLIRKYQVGLAKLSQEAMLAGDINLDGEVNVRDASLISSYVMANK